MNKKIIVVGLGLVSVLSLSACSDKYTQQFQDAPRSGVVDKNAADVITMPDGFNNIATKCDGHGHRLYVTYHGDSPYGSVTAIADPQC